MKRVSILLCIGLIVLLGVVWLQVRPTKADLKLTLHGPTQTILPGLVTYAIAVSNAGPHTARNVMAIDKLEAGAEVKQPFPTVSQGTVRIADGVTQLYFGDLPKGQVATAQVTVRLTPVMAEAASGTVYRVYVGSEVADPVPDNDTQTFAKFVTP